MEDLPYIRTVHSHPKGYSCKYQSKLTSSFFLVFLGYKYLLIHLWKRGLGIHVNHSKDMKISRTRRFSELCCT